MKKILLLLALSSAFNINKLHPQEIPDIEIYLLTCHPGKEVYSIYGHSALRIVDRSRNSDLVYNWGVFDFNTTHFVWKFAKGRLNYMLGVYDYESFLSEYMIGKRSVYSQRINLQTLEMDILFGLLKENLKEENRNYRYDFFYDDCSTRIRDILEKSTGNHLIYPPDETRTIPTFRFLINQYQKVMPWLKTGINLVIGTPGDKKAYLRDRMFLPLDLQTGLSMATLNRNGKMIPLLGKPVSLLEFDQQVYRQKFYSDPLLVLIFVFIVVIWLSASLKSKKSIKTLDTIIFLFYSVLSLFMIFFNFITDHEQTKWNLNMVWLNPFIILCIASILLNKPGITWFRIVFWLAVISLGPVFFIPQMFDRAFIPLIMILILRSSVRADFSWNPFPSAGQ
jgi:hypothetical protein